MLTVKFFLRLLLLCLLSVLELAPSFGQLRGFFEFGEDSLVLLRDVVVLLGGYLRVPLPLLGLAVRSWGFSRRIFFHRLAVVAVTLRWLYDWLCDIAVSLLGLFLLLGRRCLGRGRLLGRSVSRWHYRRCRRRRLMLGRGLGRCPALKQGSRHFRRSVGLVVSSLEFRAVAAAEIMC